MTFTIIETVVSETPSPHADEYRVPMRDGVELATDVYLPDDVSTHSAILVRTPYDKSSRYTALVQEAEYYRSRGFVFVTQDVRGKFRSAGITVPYAYDVADGYDTVEWITQQAWSNGSVGVTGASYYGFTTWAAVASGHPAIKAAIPQVTGIDMGAAHVGARWINEVPSIASLNDLLQIWTDNKGYLAQIDWGSDTVENIIAASRAEIGPSIGADDKLARSSDEGWYNPYGDRHPYHTTTIPILHWQNWYDPGLAPLGMRDWRHFRSLGGTRNLHYLRAGSADHAGFQLADVGRGDERNPYVSDQALAEKIAIECGEMADFFDEFLNGNAPERPRDRARWHVGHVGWQASEEYPPPSTPHVLHLRAAAADRGIHALDLRPNATESSLAWTHDPENPVPSSTDIEAIWYLLAEYPDEQALADHPDVLTFRTAPLEDDLDFAGQPVLEAQITFAEPSTHVFATLQDIEPSGVTRPISWGRTVLNRATGGALHLVMDDNAYRIRRGHALQLQVRSSDFPHWLVDRGTGANPWTETDSVKVECQIGIGGPSGASLTLPRIAVGANASGQADVPARQADHGPADNSHVAGPAR